MNLRLKAMASKAGFHKPEAGPPYRSFARQVRAQGGSLVFSARESARANLHSSPNRRPAVVGLAVPPYGLPSTDPTTRPSAVVTRCVTPVPSAAGAASAAAAVSTVPVAPSLQLAKHGWSAHADNSARFGNSPLNPLPSRWNRPLERPACFRTEDLGVPEFVHLSAAVSAPQGWLL